MNIKSVLRWCAMPFAAIGGAFIVYAFISLWIKGNSYGFEVYNGVEVGSITHVILAIFAQAVHGAAFVFCGASVAPSNQKVCAIVLSTIMSIFCVLSFLLSMFINGFMFLQLIHSIATIAGSIIVARQFMKDDFCSYNTSLNL